MSKLHQLWCEGDPSLDFTGTHLGQGKGSSLEEVCDDLASNNPYFAENAVWVETGTHPTYKGRRMFLSEEEARASFG